ncbi:MAG: metallophosphatase family protein, partial [Endomicrobia bacterium]|nr:metallophosphatase family protein [Endomicrobiia bacterium]
MIAIISDIHSNFEALNAVIDDFKNYSITEIFCCGDIVGYGPNPNECIEILKNKNILSVIGNHDAAIIDEVNLDWFNKDAKEAILINKKIISQENLKYIKTLPRYIIKNELLLVHGSPRDPIYEYLLTPNFLEINIKHMKQKICFCGHTHIPLIYSKSSDEKSKIYYPKNNFSIKLEKDKKYIINVGSIGQPRDLDNKACYVIFDDENYILHFKRIDY